MLGSHFGRQFEVSACVLCGRNAESSEGVLSTVSRGLPTLLEFSRRREDVELHEYLMSKPEKVLVHNECRRDYVDERRFAQQQKRKVEVDEGECETPKLLRSKLGTFTWKTDCFLCATVVDKSDKGKHRMREACTENISSTVHQKCLDRADEWAFEVQGRLAVCGDLRAADAVYHTHCYKCFTGGRPKPDSCGFGQTIRGRPANLEIMQVFNSVCERFEYGDCELFTVTDIRDEMIKAAANPDEVWVATRIKECLRQRYGQDIQFSSVEGRRDVVCFVNTATRIINDKWYAERNQDVHKERDRIILTAARLIRGAIREAEYSVTSYPSPAAVADKSQAMEWLPQPLQLLLQNIIGNELKQIALGHSIVQACRPRSVISPILFGVGVSLDHAFGSQWLLNTMSRLGYSISYDEVTRFKQSVVMTDENELPPRHPEYFTQWSGDNVDHNVVTLDGRGTFHGMGMLSMSVQTQGTDTSAFGRYGEAPVKRMPRVDVVSLKANSVAVKLLPHMETDADVLRNTIFKPLDDLKSAVTEMPTLSSLDLLWHSGYFFTGGSQQRPNWAGFMQEVSTGEHPSVAEFRMLPLIDLNPNDKSCVLSTLTFVMAQANKIGIRTPVITFDQPLWLKAVEVSKAHSLDIVCRLGGFHTIMNFLGSIGCIMAGSGLQEVLETCYGPNAVGHMLAGRSVARALRGHYLVQSALYSILLNPEFCPNIADSECEVETLSDGDRDHLHQMYNSVVVDRGQQFDSSDMDCLDKLMQAIVARKDSVTHSSATAQLWVQYIEHVDLLKAFIRAERTGDWDLHLYTLSKMINVFAACGHNKYAKSGRLYLEMMLDLPNTHPELHDLFARHGLHSVRRSDRYWGAISTDLAIEQVLMKALKSRGGLTHGRGMTESVRLLWVYSMHKCASVHSALAYITGSEHCTSEVHHIEYSDGRMIRDHEDLTKIVHWFQTRNPFDTDNSSLRSIATGVVARDNDGVNCHIADSVGSAIMKEMDNQGFSTVVLKKAKQVKTLQSVGKAVKVHDQETVVDSSVLFNRLLIAVEREDNMEPYFSYELTPTPTALFKDDVFRKTAKSKLAQELVKLLGENQTVACADRFVLDGGCLLHRVVWPPDSTYAEIVSHYVQYVKRHYGHKCHIVFDGYSVAPTPKDLEHERRRESRMSPDIDVEEHIPAYHNQAGFMMNTHNKSLFIRMLAAQLQQHQYTVRHAVDDADTLIVKTALEFCVHAEPVTVVADDTDILVLLVHHFNQSMADLYMLSATGGQKAKTASPISIRDLCCAVGSRLAEQLPVIHAISGCDTTSALFGHGKGSVMRKVLNHPDSDALVWTLTSAASSVDDVARDGLRLVRIIYGCEQQSLDHGRYVSYMNMLARSSIRPRPERLPPTERAVFFHILRVHLQAVQWHLLSTEALQPCEWGWQLVDGKGLRPVLTDKKCAPDKLTKVIFCKCKMSTKQPCSTKLCSCRKHGLPCVKACLHCSGEDCDNGSPQDDIDADLDDDINDDAAGGVDDWQIVVMGTPGDEEIVEFC